MKDFANNQQIVLVIDDKQDVLQQVTSALATANYTSCCCTTAETALAAAEETHPDLIISATHINGTSGMKICDQIKQCSGLEHVPVMFLSVGQIPDIIRRHDASGGTYFIRKPFDSTVLVELADKALHMPELVGE